MDDGAESQHSYTGSDTDFYYELKDERISRKKDLLEERELHQKERALTRELESSKEQEVYAAYEAMLESQKKGDRPRPRLESIAGKQFYLYSVDHVDYCYDDFLYPSKYVEFYFIGENGGIGHEPYKIAKIQGHVYLNSSSGGDFEPFRQPKRAGRKKRRLKVQGSETELVFRFISDRYLTMTARADWEMIEMNVRKSEAADMPDVFKFVGIHMDLEERKRTEELWREWRHKVRGKTPPSPGETFFERTHHMGDWNMGW